ncbi:MAG: aromatic ring hydroxylase, partial [Xanthomonadaceae bacterium]|nr:aromatic ring hydroxylase [Xanthomonadaceae bacterium]
MRTKEEYLQGLKKMKRNLYHNGGKIDRDDPEQFPALNVMGVTFDAAYDPETADLCTATSHLTGEKINRFCHVHQTTEDLHKKQDMTRTLCRKVGYCIQRCMGIDAINALNAVSFEADRANKGTTEYHQNFKKWLEYFQTNDLVGSCAQTDVKGERLKRPAQQTDPDAYLHVVERKSDGIVVRGCKLHISEASIADEILVVPTRALGPDEKDYAVAFAIPADYDGIKQVVSIHNFRPRKHIKRGFDAGYTDSYVIFDDVFVPWERVFLCGENDHGGICALLFALFHRHSYSGCKPAIGDVLLGAAALAAEVNGIEKTSHVRTLLAEIIKVSELGYAAGFTASALGKPEVIIPGMGPVPYGPGAMIPNSIYANVGRCLTGEAVFHEQEILCDIAGGVPATFPYEGDLVSSELKPLLDKYIKRNPKIPVEEQIKFWLYFAEMTCSSLAGVLNYGNYHGGGSPIMEQIAITSQYDIKLRKKLLKALSGIRPLAPGEV